MSALNSSGHTGPAVLFADRGCFLAFAGAEIIEFLAPRLALFLDFDFRDPWRMHWENAFHSFAVGNTPDGKRLVYSRAFAANHDSGENLDPFFIALAHPGVNAHAITD